MDKKNNKLDANMQLMVVAKDLDISEMTPEQIEFTNDFIVKNIKLNKLEEAITETVMDLSNVGAPSWGADIEYLAMDNQRRLEIINSLTRNFDMVKGWVKAFKKNKNNCCDNFDGKYSLVDYTIDLLKELADIPRFKYISMANDKITLLMLQGKLDQVKQLQEGIKMLEEKKL